jgi:dCMP deaminase
MSAFIIGVVLPMILKMKFGQIKWKQKKLNRYDKAYLRIATEWGVCPIVKRKQVGAIIVTE